MHAPELVLQTQEIAVEVFRDPNCDEAMDRVAIVTEKITPETVIMAPAITESTVRAPSGVVSSHGTFLNWPK